MTDIKQQLCWQGIFKCYPIFDTICAYLEPRDIFALRLTTKDLSPFFETLFKTQWNINRQLGRFVQDPVAFRERLGRCGALISGSFALGFFDRRVWREADLDVYLNGSLDGSGGGLRDSEGFWGIGEYLVGREGYQLVDVKTEENGGLVEFTRRVKHISQLKTYVKKVSNKEEIRIQILYTIGTPLKAILNGFRQTLVMNIISWNCAYSLFPDLNFIKRKSYGINGDDYGDDDVNYEVGGDGENPVAKYERRGWKWERAAAEDEKNVRSLNMYGRRRNGDSYTWCIPLDVAGVEPGEGEPPSVLQHSFFKVEQLMPLSGPGQYIIHVKIVKSFILKYEYTTSIAYYDRHAFWALVGEKLEALTHAELLKFSEAERPIPLLGEGQTEGYFARVDEMSGRLPEGWTFYDDLIPKWYEEYVEKDEEARAERMWFEKQAGNLRKSQKEALDK